MSGSFLSARRGLAAGGALLLLGGSAVGIAAAQTAPSTPTPAGAQARQAQPGYQAFIDALAKRLGITSDALQTAVGQARTDAGLPAAGGFGPGHGGPGGPGGGGPSLSAAATVIGIPVNQLQQELASKSLADVATAHGKAPADVATALKNAAHTRVDQEVTSGRLTASQATQQKQQIDQRIDQQMTQVMPQRDQGNPGNRGGFGRNLSAAAQALGIPVTQLQQELPGKSLAQVAESHGKTAADVATALKNAAHDRIDQDVTAGRLTADQAAQQKTQVDQRIDQQVTEVMPSASTGA